jgi:hypothetical protein
MTPSGMGAGSVASEAGNSALRDQHSLFVLQCNKNGGGGCKCIASTVSDRSGPTEAQKPDRKLSAVVIH